MAIFSTHGAYEQTNGHALKRVLPNVVFGNVINLPLEQARYSTVQPEVSSEYLLSLFEDSSRGEREFFQALATQKASKPSQSVESANASAGLDLILAGEYGGKEMVELMAPELRQFLASLFTFDTTIADWGKCVYEELTKRNQTYGLNVGSSVTPSSGYARKHVLVSQVQAFQQTFGSEKLESHLGLYGYASPASSAVSQIAKILMQLDIPRLKFDMFANVESNKGMDMRNKQFGLLAMWGEFGRRMFSFFQLYRISAIRLLRAHNERARALGRVFYDQRFAQLSDEYAKLEREADAEFAKLPVHPIVTYIESVYRSGRVLTETGEHDAIYWAGDASHFPETPDPVPYERPGCEYGTPVFISEYSRALSKIALVTTSGPCAAAEWRVDAFKDNENDTITAAELIARLRGQKDLLTMMTEMTRKLGWSSLSADIGTIDCLGHDIALSDGRKSDRSPDACAVGFTPVLSLGQRKAQGITWNIIEIEGLEPASPRIVPRPFGPAEIEVWTIPIKGHIDVHITREHLERRYLPRSMAMGERNVSPDANAWGVMATRDPAAFAMLSYFKSRSSLYLKAEYRTREKTVVGADSPDTLPHIHVSFWDPYGLATTQDGMSSMVSEWTTYIKPEAASPDDLAWVIPEGEAFYGRYNVMKSVDPLVTLLNEQGNALITRRAGGVIVVDTAERNTLGADFASLDKLYVAVAPPALARPLSPVSADDLLKAARQ